MATEFYAPILSGSGAFQRKWGTEKNVVEPYITGYHFGYFQYIPPGVGVVLENLFPDAPPAKSINNILSSLIMSVDIPPGTLNKIEFPGVGGIKSTAPAFQEIDNSFSVKFLEVSGIPVFKILSSWCYLMRDTVLGVTSLPVYNKSNYAGSMYYWTTKPDGVSIEFAAYITGIYPTKNPFDAFSHDLTNIDRLDITAEFAMDYILVNKEVYSKCASLAAIYKKNA